MWGRKKETKETGDTFAVFTAKHKQYEDMIAELQTAREFLCPSVSAFIYHNDLVRDAINDKVLKLEVMQDELVLRKG